MIGPFAVVLDQIRRSNFADLELVVINQLAAAPPLRRKRGKAETLAGMLSDPVRRRRLAFTLYSHWDEKKNRDAVDLLGPVDCSDLLDGVETITVEPVVKGFVHRFPDDATQLTVSRNLDVIFRFGFNIIRGDILRAARYGIWSYHHGDNDYYRGGPSHFWELFENNPCSGVVLQVLNEELDNGIILDKAIASSAAGFSHARNRIAPYALGTIMAIRALHDLHEHGWEFIKQRATSSAIYKGERKIYRLPSNDDMLHFVGRRVVSTVRRRLHNRGREYHWRMAYRRVSGGDMLPSNLDGFQWIESPRDRSWADPFLVHHNGRTFDFFEDYSYSNQRGTISCAELLADGKLGEVTRVLDEPWHLSYPFVFNHAGEMFMIPESERNDSIDLYRASNFPYQWKKEKTLLNVGGLDTTIHQQDGSLWMFTAVVDPPGGDYSLLLFHGSTLFGDWRFHPANPISTDVRNARSAGRILSSGDKLIRPAQDCSVRYGYALRFQQITTLNPHAYSEEPFGTILPSEKDGIYAVHSYAQGGGFEMIDGAVLRYV
jgi:hypothetical protein